MYGHPAEDLRGLEYLSRFSFDKAIPSTINSRKEKEKEEENMLMVAWELRDHLRVFKKKVLILL